MKNLEFVCIVGERNKERILSYSNHPIQNAMVLHADCGGSLSSCS